MGSDWEHIEPRGASWRVGTAAKAKEEEEKSEVTRNPFADPPPSENPFADPSVPPRTGGIV